MSFPTAIVPIVEGQSEVKSVGPLLRRIMHERLRFFDIEIARPFRVSRNKVTQSDELERAIRTAILDRTNASAILILLDAHDDPPCVLGPNLEHRASLVTQLPTSVVLATREFEAWFLGAKESLRGERGIKRDAVNLSYPESISGAKEHLLQNMERGCHYVEVDDQPALAARMDLEMARRNCPSFDKLVREVERLAREIHMANAE